MAGFNNTPSASEFHRFSSWGRTRRPKLLTDDSPIGSNVTLPTATEVTVVANTALSDALTSTVAGQNGYATENQRFLTVCVEEDDGDNTGGLAVAIYGYCYAIGKWAKLQSIQGADNLTDMTITPPDAADAGNVTGRVMATFEISGIDRVAFVGTAADVKVWAACSTF